MKAIKHKRLLITIMFLAILVGVSIIILRPRESTGQKRYEACLKQPVNQNPNGCAPPGFCDAPNDGYVRCNE
jgi:hypothetical protein